MDFCAKRLEEEAGIAAKPFRIRCGEHTGQLVAGKCSPEEKEEFRHSDEAEWGAIVGTGSVRVLSLDESQLVRRRTPQRIISSRMVRRWTPHEGADARPKA